MQVTHADQYRQTTTTSEDLLGERAIKQQQPAHKQGVHLCTFEGVNWGMRESVCEKERESESWCESGIELQTKSNTTHHRPSLRSTESSGVREDTVTTFHE